MKLVKATCADLLSKYRAIHLYIILVITNHCFCINKFETRPLLLNASVAYNMPVVSIARIVSFDAIIDTN